MTKPKYKSEAMESIHLSATAMFSIGSIDKEKMLEYDRLCLVPIETPTRPRYSLADLMAEMPQGLPRVEGWDEMPSVGSEMSPDRGTAERLSAERRDLPSDTAETLLTYRSDADEAIHASAKALFSIGVFNEMTMREFDEACLTELGETEEAGDSECPQK